MWVIYSYNRVVKGIKHLIRPLRTKNLGKTTPIIIMYNS